MEVGSARADARRVRRRRARSVKEPSTRRSQKLGAQPAALFSTLGRVAARALESERPADRIDGMARRARRQHEPATAAIADTAKWDPRPGRRVAGVGFHEVPRGALGHWVEIKDGTIAHYQAVVPTTWNASPRDAQGQPGPYEEALVGTPVADPTSRSSSCGRCTRSIPASRAPSTWSTRERTCSPR